jgi:hypothetical protein
MANGAVTRDMNTHHPSFIKVMEKAGPFIQERHAAWALASIETLCDYFAWYWNRGTVSIFFDRLGEVDGVCMIKLFRYLNQAMDKWVHEPCGQFALVEVLIADHPKAIAGTFRELFARWGKQDFILWDRGERTEGGPHRIYTWKQYLKLTRRLTDGLVS